MYDSFAFTHSIPTQTISNNQPSPSLQTGVANMLANDLVVRNLHVKRAAAVAHVLGGQDGALLADEKGCAVGVASHVVGADRQVGNLQLSDSHLLQCRGPPRISKPGAGHPADLAAL